MRYARPVKKVAICAGFCLLALGANAQRNGGGGRGQQAPATPIAVMPLSGGAYWTTGGAGANTGFIVGSSGVIVIEDRNHRAVIPRKSEGPAFY